jgi:hypothetical protein
VKKSGDYAYVAAGSTGIIVVDVGVPSRPEIVATIDTDDATDLDVYNDYLFVADRSTGIRAIDVTDPTAPGAIYTFKGSIGDATVISAVDERAYVLDDSGDTAIHAVDISDPAGMSSIHVYQDAAYDFQDLDALYINDTFTYIYATVPDLADDSVVALDFYAAPVGNDQINYWTRYNNTGDVYIPEYVTATSDYVAVLARVNFDLEPPPEYALLTFSTSLVFQNDSDNSVEGWIADVSAVGDRVYAVDGIGLRVYDVSTLSTPSTYYFQDTPGDPTGVDTDGGYAYMAAGVPLFQTVDINLPTELSIAGSYGEGVPVYDVAVQGDHAFLAVGGSTPRLQVLDISMPDDPQPEPGGSIAMSSPRTVAVSGGHAFVGDTSDGLRIFDISDPGTPVEVGSASKPFAGTMKSIVLKGDYAYIASSENVQLIDIADPAQPVGIGIYDAESVTVGMSDVDVRGQRIFVTDGGYFQPNSLKIIDVSEPDTPVLMKKILNDTQEIEGVTLSGDYAFVTDPYGGGGSGFYAVNVNPASGLYLQEYGPCNTNAPGTAMPHGVAAHGDYAYTVDENKG